MENWKDGWVNYEQLCQLDSFRQTIKNGDVKEVLMLILNFIFTDYVYKLKLVVKMQFMLFPTCTYQQQQQHQLNEKKALQLRAMPTWVALPFT